MLRLALFISWLFLLVANCNKVNLLTDETGGASKTDESLTQEDETDETIDEPQRIGGVFLCLLIEPAADAPDKDRIGCRVGKKTGDAPPPEVQQPEFSATDVNANPIAIDVETADASSDWHWYVFVEKGKGLNLIITIAVPGLGSSSSKVEELPIGAELPDLPPSRTDSPPLASVTEVPANGGISTNSTAGVYTANLSLSEQHSFALSASSAPTPGAACQTQASTSPSHGLAIAVPISVQAGNADVTVKLSGLCGNSQDGTTVTFVRRNGASDFVVQGKRASDSVNLALTADATPFTNKRLEGGEWYLIIMVDHRLLAGPTADDVYIGKIELSGQGNINITPAIYFTK